MKQIEAGQRREMNETKQIEAGQQRRKMNEAKKAGAGRSKVYAEYIHLVSSRNPVILTRSFPP